MGKVAELFKKDKKGDKKETKILSQNDVVKIINASVTDIVQSVQRIALKAASAESIDAAVKGMTSALNEFANSMGNDAAFKGMWFKFIKFKIRVKRLVKYANSLYEVTKDSEPGVQAIATISVIVKHLVKIIKELTALEVPFMLQFKMKRLNKVLHRLTETIGVASAIGEHLQKSKADKKVKTLNEVIKNLGEAIKTIKGMHVGVFMQLTLSRIDSALWRIQRIIRRVARMRRLGRANRKLISIKLFFYGLATLLTTIVLLTPVFLIAPLSMFVIMLVMGVFWLLMKVVNWIMGKIAKTAIIAALKMLIITIALTAMALCMLILAVIAKTIVEQSLWILALLGVILVTAVLLGVIGYIVNALGAVFMSSLAGLLGITLMLGMLLGISFMIYLMVEPAKAIVENYGDLMLMLAGIVPILLAVGAIGMAGIGAYIALAFMPGNVLLIGSFYALFMMISTIANTTLNMEKIRENIGNAKTVIDMIKSNFGSFSFKGRKARQAKRGLRRIKRIVRQIEAIIRQLNRIQGFKLKQRAITKNIDLVWKTVDQIESEISGRVDPGVVSGPFWKRWKKMAELRRKANNAQRMLARVNRILGQCHRIIQQLNKIQDFKLKAKAITGNIEKVFAVIDQIEAYLMKGYVKEEPKQYKWYEWGKRLADERRRRQQAAAEMLQRIKAGAKINRAERILLKLTSMTENLEKIQNIKLDKNFILGRIDELFNIIDAIDQHMVDKSKLPKDKEELVKQAVNTYRQVLSEEWQALSAKKQFDRVEAILIKTNNIVEVFKTIANLRLNGNAVKKKISTLFRMSRDIFDMVMQGDMLTEEYAKSRSENAKKYIDGKSVDWNKQGRMENAYKEQFKYANEHMGMVDTILSKVSEIHTKFSAINKLKIKPEKTKANVKLLFNTVSEVFTMLMNETFPDVSAEDFNDKFEDYFGLIDAVNEKVKGFGEIKKDTVKMQKIMLSNYGNFLNKINKIDVEKVKTTTDMFAKMADFSDSIHGDFDKLAEALSSKLLPVLEELKEVMSDVPEKLEQGFQNTSASIAAANGPVTEEGTAAQVKRENNNLTKEEVDKIVRTRMSDYAKSNAGGVTAKLDELLSLLRGYGGSRAVVRIG